MCVRKERGRLRRRQDVHVVKCDTGRVAGTAPIKIINISL